MLQLVGHNMVQYADDSGTITLERMDAALHMAKGTFEEDVCHTTLAALSDRDIDFLVAMTHDDETSGITDVARRMGVSNDYAQKYRRRLLGAGIISSPRRGRVQFAVPYLASFLAGEAGRAGR